MKAVTIKLAVAMKLILIETTVINLIAMEIATIEIAVIEPVVIELLKLRFMPNATTMEDKG